MYVNTGSKKIHEVKTVMKTTFGNFNIELAKIYRNRQNQQRYKDIRKKFDKLTSIEYSSTAEYPFFLKADGEFSNVDNKLDHKASLIHLIQQKSYKYIL